MKHTCHWDGCEKQVPPKMWGCSQHWFRLPKVIRDRIWLTYKPGQEVSKTPSPRYLIAARGAQKWIELAKLHGEKEATIAFTKIIEENGWPDEPKNELQR